MAHKAHIHALMTEIGPALELGEVQAFDKNDLWTLVTQGKTVIFAEYAPDDDRLWLSADVGPLQPGDRLRLYELMLQYNARWQQTGGVRLALDAPEGDVVLAYDLPAAGLDLHRLQNVIRNFCAALEGWRRIVGVGPAAAERTEVAETFDPRLMAGMIRG